MTMFTNSLLGMVGHDVLAAKHVVPMWHRLKMARIYTGRLSAQMVKFQTIWNTLARQLISKPMCLNLPPCAVGAGAYLKSPVTAAALVACPQPTGVGLVDLGPESILNVLAGQRLGSSVRSHSVEMGGTERLPIGDFWTASNSAYSHTPSIDHWRSTVKDTWRILQKRRDPAAFDDRLNYEEVLVMRRPC